MAGFQNVRQGFNAARRIRDAIVQNDNRPGNEIPLDQPPDVPHWRMYQVVRAGRTKDASITARLSQSDLFYKGRSQEKSLSRGWNFSCFAAHLIERDRF